MKLIDKNTLIAEIKKLIPLPAYERETLHSEFVRGKVIAYNNILDLLKSFEVEEVDLEKEYQEYVKEDPVYNKLVNGIVGKAIAKHFFELSLKAQKGEEV